MIVKDIFKVSRVHKAFVVKMLLKAELHKKTPTRDFLCRCFLYELIFYYGNSRVKVSLYFSDSFL